ncbi:MAG: hypothetical protein CM1200mP27_07310 [Chloroflexota bacterium]|nr:MAG: hypothetical protein CM1200mP27_07310 [Chloroflexota bacterium]
MADELDRLNQKRQTQKRGLCRDHRLEGVVGILELEVSIAVAFARTLPVGIPQLHGILQFVCRLFLTFGYFAAYAYCIAGKEFD